MGNDFALSRIQVFSVIGTIMLIAILFYFIRRRKLQEEYSILWLLISFLFLIVAVFTELLEIISSLIGIFYPPATLFLMLIIGLFLLMLHFSVIISGLKKKLNSLSIKIALLEEQLGSQRKGE
jgi:hypothetical protein